MSTLAVTPTYKALLKKFPPRIIRTEEQNESYIAALYELEQGRSSWTTEEKDLADLFTLLIETFEEKTYSLPRCSSLEMIQFLMEQHHLRQKDLADIFGTPSIVSEVLSGKRKLNKEHIRRLSERFHVSPELFF